MLKSIEGFIKLLNYRVSCARVRVYWGQLGLLGKGKKRGISRGCIYVCMYVLNVSSGYGWVCRIKVGE